MTKKPHRLTRDPTVPFSYGQSLQSQKLLLCRRPTFTRTPSRSFPSADLPTPSPSTIPHENNFLNRPPTRRTLIALLPEFARAPVARHLAAGAAVDDGGVSRLLAADEARLGGTRAARLPRAEPGVRGLGGATAGQRGGPPVLVPLTALLPPLTATDHPGGTPLGRQPRCQRHT